MSTDTTGARPLYTDTEILEGISRALTARDMPAVAALTRRLAIQAPNKAQLIVDTIQTGKHPLDRLLDTLR